jgi:hypothetical protein
VCNRSAPPNFSVCFPEIFEKLSDACHVLFGCVVVSVGLPMLKLLNESGGRASNPSGPEGMMPRVPLPVTKPRSESFANPPCGLSVVVEVRVKLKRASFTIVGPSTFVLLKTACCARVGVIVGKPGTLDAGKGFVTVESS